MVYTVKEVQELFKVSRKVVIRAIAKGNLDAFKVGREWRIKEESIKKYLGLSKKGGNMESVNLKMLQKRINLINKQNKLELLKIEKPDESSILWLFKLKEADGKYELYMKAVPVLNFEGSKMVLLYAGSVDEIWFYLDSIRYSDIKYALFKEVKTGGCDVD